MGTVLTAHTFGFAVGPPLAGWILEYWGYAVPFYVCAAIAAVNFLTIVWIAEPEKHGGMKSAIREQEDQLITDEEQQQPNERTPLVRGDHHTESKPAIGMVGLMKNWKITSCVLCVIVSASVFSGIEPALPIYLRDQYGASSSTTGCKLFPPQLTCFDSVSNCAYRQSFSPSLFGFSSYICFHGHSCFPFATDRLHV